ncbi:MAG: DUF72 domain-containing protein [candidate division Zixibacteria bacterium]|nr:DUF72 domain-containing protein [candidate division Zixibacteria bacterium]
MVPDNIKIGTAGFSYKDWLGNFYPQFCPQADFLRYYASRFSTVELDSTFYRIPTEATIAKWAASTPDGFRFSAKFPRTVTHEGDTPARLEQAQYFVDIMRGLGGKLGALLLQFPYSFKPESSGLLKSILDVLPKKDISVAVEVRNKAWLSDDFYAWLRKRNVALCLVEHPWMPRLSVQTADFHYLRFLGDHKKISEDFSYVRRDCEDDLVFWGNLLQHLPGSPDAYTYFNNHYSGHAPSTAIRLVEILGT